MKHYRKRKCRCCQELFHPDPRNRHHQHYCSKPACRKASKAASQRRWLSNPENQDYFRGPANVGRVQAWRAAHPGYGRHTGSHSRNALQEDCIAQPLDKQGKSGDLASCALQDLLCSQPLVLIGLIAHLTNTALQEDIAQTGLMLQHLGQDILTGAGSAKGGCHAKTFVDSRANSPGSSSV
jgi:hypothetical protein